LRWTDVRYFEIAPTLGAMDISLSLRMTTRSRAEWPALFRPSYAKPEVKRAVAEDSDDLVGVTSRSRPAAIPSAAEIEVARVAGAERVVFALACA
jgi:hypothetical protein